MSAITVKLQDARAITVVLPDSFIEIPATVGTLQLEDATDLFIEDGTTLDAEAA